MRFLTGETSSGMQLLGLALYYGQSTETILDLYRSDFYIANAYIIQNLATKDSVVALTTPKTASR